MGRLDIRLIATAGILALACQFSGAADAAAQSAAGSAPIRGLVRALNQSAIATDLTAPVAKLNIREAQSFKKGDVLVTFDCERARAEQAAAEAVYREMTLTLESNTYLDRKGAVGRFEVEISRARVDKAGAEAAALKARLKQCEVVAPYDGRVAELSINEHEIPAPGKPFITLLDETSFEIDLIMPSGNLKQLKPGMEFKYHVDDTGHTYDAIVLRPGAAVDPVSQTVKVIGKFLHPEVDVIAGMTGTAEFPFQGVTQ